MRTHNLGDVESVEWHHWPSSLSARELECGQQPEASTDAIEDGGVPETEGDMST